VGNFGVYKDHTTIKGHDQIGTRDFTPSPPAPPQIVDLDTGEPLTCCDVCGFLYRHGDWPLCRGEGGAEAHVLVSMRKFSEFDFDSDEGTIHISSIADVRKLERESMQRYEAGRAGDPRYKDARPYVLRQYSRDPGNASDPIEIVRNPEKRPEKRTRRGMPIRGGFIPREG
jgi:hypothetical protein